MARVATGLRRVGSGALVLCATLAAPAAAGEPPLSSRARERLDRGLGLYEARRFDEALEEFRAGYAIDPRRELMFAMAQAERLKGDCAAAIEHYRVFLERDPPRAQGDAAREMIARCEAAMATVPPAAPAAPPTRAGAPASRAEHAVRDGDLPARSPWYSDVWGDLLLSAGVASVGVGAGLFVASNGARDDAGSAAGYDEYAERIEDARGKRAGAVVALSTGVVLVAAAVVRYVLR